LNLPVEMIILEGVRRRDEWIRCRDVIPDETWVPSVVRAIDMEQLGEIELGILREIDGKNSIEQIALANRLAFFHVMMFVYQGMNHDLFEVREPGDEITAIPGFSKGSWSTLLHQVEELVGEGNLLAAYRRLAEIRDKYGGNHEANEQVECVQDKIADAVETLNLSNSAVLKLAIPPSEITSLTCSPQEGFLLSRINGSYSLGEILKVVPGSELENKLLVNNLVQRGVVRPEET
jgi:hypothetical protein